MIKGLFPMAADILHTGHLLALKEAKEHCDYLIVALNCKPDGKRPIQSVYERFIQLQAVKYIDEIIVYEGKTDLELVCSSLDYQIRFLGSDYKNKDWDGKEIETKLQKKTYFIQRNHSLSSTNLKNRIVNNK